MSDSKSPKNSRAALNAGTPPKNGTASLNAGGSGQAGRASLSTPAIRTNPSRRGLPLRTIFGIAGAIALAAYLLQEESEPIVIDQPSVWLAMEFGGNKILVGKGENGYEASVDACADRDKCWFFSSIDSTEPSCIAVKIEGSGINRRRVEKMSRAPLPANEFQNFCDDTSPGRCVSVCNYTP